MKNIARSFIMIIVLILLFSSCDNNEVTKSKKSHDSVSLQKLSYESHKRESTPITVIIDAGHGFDDPGSVPEQLGCKECDITLNAAFILKEELNKRKIKSVMTHEGDKYIDEMSLMRLADKYGVAYDDKRIDNRIVDNNIFSAYERYIYEQIISKQTKNCLFISLHTNSAENSPGASGASIDFCEENRYLDSLLKFSNQMKNELAVNLGTEMSVFCDEYSMAYIVTKYQEIPSVLIELGFGSNKDDAEKLNSNEWLHRFCAEIADCVSDFDYRTSSDTVTNS